MHEAKKEYAAIVVNRMLQLREGEALSVNTEQTDLDFARIVAQEALEKTGTTVRIVVTKDGKPVDVLEFDPPRPNTEITGVAMLRLARENNELLVCEEAKPEDFVLMQNLGHLAEPVLLGRRIAVPWCVIPVFEFEKEEPWAKLSQKVDFNLTHVAPLVSYRQKYLHQYDIETLIFKGRNVDFSVGLPEGVHFYGGEDFLGNHERNFMNTVDFDRLTCSTDKGRANGSFESTLKILGNEMTCLFEFEDGVLVNWTHNPITDSFFAMDEALKRVGSVSLRDKEIRINLGCSVLESLDVIPSEEESLPEFFNLSDFVLVCPLASDTDVYCLSCEGKETQLMKKGYFLE